ncbi:MAG: hypothetical protein J6C82_01245 [Clostridia bacterium]|nr:hypothetical protein [Clostridia bacterium]
MAYLNEIISGVIVTLIVTFLIFFGTKIINFFKKLFTELNGKAEVRKEISQLINKANDEIKKGVKSYITEDSPNNLFIVRALFNSTARKYGVPIEKLNSLVEICEDVIKEINDDDLLVKTEKEARMENVVRNIKELQNLSDVPKVADTTAEKNNAETERIESESENDGLKV